MAITGRGRGLLLALIPFGLQKRLMAALAWLAQRVVRSPTIDYRGHRIHLLPNDPYTAHVLVSQLYWRSWHHESGPQAVVERIIASRRERVFFVDGGACFGMYTFLAASLPAVEKVITVEASPLNFATLQRSVKESSVAQRIDCRHAALSNNTDRRFALVDTIDSSAWHQVTDSGPQDNSIPALTIDSLAAELALRAQDTLFVKLDIEGSEVDAVQGMGGTLGEDRDTFLMLEFHTTLLNRETDGAHRFARTLFSMGMEGVYVMDDAQPRLWEVPSLEVMLAYTDELARASFPNNLCNLLLTRRGLGAAADAIEIRPLKVAAGPTS